MCSIPQQVARCMAGVTMSMVSWPHRQQRNKYGLELCPLPCILHGMYNVFVWHVHGIQFWFFFLQVCVPVAVDCSSLDGQVVSMATGGAFTAVLTGGIDILLIPLAVLLTPATTTSLA